MGEGGNLVLVNGTKYDWYAIEGPDFNSYQMNSWPKIGVKAGQTQSLYIEWDDALGVQSGDDAANQLVGLVGSNCQFQLMARPRYLSVALKGLQTKNNPMGSVIPLGWQHNIPANASVQFILAGQDGDFWSNNPPVAWMQAALPTFGHRALGQFCMPGSHDAGMSTISGGRFLGDTTGKGDSITQTNNIGGQLQLGARFFDIRPVMAGGQFATGHYTNRDGANGELLTTIIAEINAFTADNAELIILDLSHGLDTDSGAWNPLTQGQWNNLLDLLTGHTAGQVGLNARFVAPAGVSDLTTLTLNDFIGSGKAAVVIVVEDSVDVTKYAGCGVYPGSALNAFNKYTDSNDAAAMAADQMSKLLNYPRQPGNNFFVLSWTVTQTTAEAAGEGVAEVFGIEDTPVVQMADNANYDIYMRLLPLCSEFVYPNVLLIDDIKSPNITALSMAVNYKAMLG